MVGKNDLKIRGFETIYDYFDHILGSKINGQRKQAIQLYNKLSREQKDAFTKVIVQSRSTDEVIEIIEYLNI